MKGSDSEKRAVLAYLDLQLAIEMRLGLSHKEAKAKVMADFKKKIGMGNKQIKHGGATNENKISN